MLSVEVRSVVHSSCTVREGCLGEAQSTRNSTQVLPASGMQKKQGQGVRVHACLTEPHRQGLRRLCWKAGFSERAAATLKSRLLLLPSAASGLPQLLPWPGG